MFHNKTKRLTHLLIFYGTLIILWSLLYFILVNCLDYWKSYAFPSPQGVLTSFAVLMQKGILTIAIAASFTRLFVGFFISLFMGVCLGLIIVKINFLDEHLRPLLLGLQTIPSVCWIPFAILWFGLGNDAIIFIEVVGATCAMALSTIAAVRHIDPMTIKVSKIYGAKGYKLYRYVILPAAVPDLIIGLKQSWSFAWRGLMAGEILVGNNGIGQILMLGRELSDINQVAAMMILILLFGIVIERGFFGIIEGKIMQRWGLC